MPTITHQCAQCKKFFEFGALAGQPILCPHCSKNFGTMPDLQKVFESCPLCQGSQFWIQKDFNQLLGCSIILAGIVLVPWTYGLSLPVVAFIDWLLYRRVPTFVVCYKCASEFRGFPIPARFKPFLHHIGLKYDKYR